MQFGIKGLPNTLQWVDIIQIKIACPGSGKVLQVLSPHRLKIHNTLSNNWPCVLLEMACQHFTDVCFKNVHRRSQL